MQVTAITQLIGQHVWHLVKKCRRMVGLAVHPHMFRHSYAINVVRTGVDIRRVQLLLGHANLNTTQVYLQFNYDYYRAVLYCSGFKRDCHAHYDERR
jgi:site-specific recombinase XerD